MPRFTTARGTCIPEELRLLPVHLAMARALRQPFNCTYIYPILLYTFTTLDR